MTPAQFACCAQGSGRGTDAARLVLVDGMDQHTAADKCGISLQAVRNALVRIRRRDREIRAAYLPQ
jgi:DNA-directed RNA polymerase specialized sigma24 family protein